MAMEAAAHEPTGPGGPRSTPPGLPHEPGDAMPAPPWRTEARRPKTSSRTPLSREAIVDAAIHVLDTEGYDALSMRRVATELGTGAASLYAHVDNKDELLDLMIDRVVGETEFPDPDPDNWQELLKQAIRNQRRVFQAHPGIARAILGRIPLGPNGLRSMEGFLGVAAAANLPDKVLAWAGDAISLYVTAAVFEESIQQQTSPDFTDDKIEAWLENLRAYIRTLPADQFPNMIRLVEPMFEYGGPDGRFEFGLDLMVRGLATYAQPKDDSDK
jgi:AcrR family transcriptional regulator